MPNALTKFEDLKDSPVGKIPTHWDVMSLDQACLNVVDCPHTTPVFHNDGVLVARTSTIRDGRFDISSASYVCETEYHQRISRLEPKPGDIVFTREAPVGEAFVIPEGMRICLGQRTMLLRPDPAKAFPSYVLAQIYSGTVRTRIDQLVAGTTNPHLNVADVRSFLIPVPTLFEQQRIAEILNTIDSTIARTSTLIAKLKQMKAGLLHDLLTRGLDENGELRDAIEHPEQFKDSPLGQIPKDWEACELLDVVDPARPVCYGILMPGYGYPNGVPVVKVKDIINDEIKTNDLLLTSPEIDNQYYRSRLRCGDLLFTIRGTVGRMSFVPEALEGANITQDTARLAIIGAEPRYIRQYLQMPLPQAFIELHTIGQAVKGINLRDVRRIPIALPPHIK